MAQTLTQTPAVDRATVTLCGAHVDLYRIMGELADDRCIVIGCPQGYGHDGQHGPFAVEE